MQVVGGELEVLIEKCLPETVRPDERVTQPSAGIGQFDHAAGDKLKLSAEPQQECSGAGEVAVVGELPAFGPGRLIGRVCILLLFFEAVEFGDDVFGDDPQRQTEVPPSLASNP